MPDPNLLASKRRVEDRFLSLPGVHAVAIGRSGIEVSVYPDAPIPPELPDQVDGWPVSIRRERGFLEQTDALRHGDRWSSRQDRFVPVPHGVVWFPSGRTNGCTTAFLARDSDHYYMLSANHCIRDADYGNGIEQGGQKVGELAHRPGGGTDSAWFSITDENFTTELLGLSEFARGGSMSLEVGDPLTFVGGISGVQRTEVLQVDRSGSMGDVITKDYVSQPGDSGGPYVSLNDGQYRPVGVHQGAVEDTQGNKYSTFNSTEEILRVSRLEEIVTGNVMIRPGDIVNESPTARFSVETDGLAAHFDGRESSDPDGRITSYEWNVAGSVYHTTTADHTFEQAGTYDVKLTVEDNYGATASERKQVTVEAPDEPAQPPDSTEWGRIAIAASAIGLVGYGYTKTRE